MRLLLWTLLSIGALLALFAACVAAVVLLVRLLERLLGRRAVPVEPGAPRPGSRPAP